jgi:S1-C subfamily serine protease
LTLPSDDLTFRPTVLVRKGRNQGSGSVIASVDNETLVLTVAHVLKDTGDLKVELHRYNLGVERIKSTSAWPRTLPAEVVASDPTADVAILRVRGMVALPYVARLAQSSDETETEAEAGSVVTSVGIDRASDLSSWTAHVFGVVKLDPQKRGNRRRFLITDRAPEHGRSGGGLFRDDGKLVGVCVGRIDPPEGDAIGVFATGESIRRLIRESEVQAVIDRSTKRHVAADRARSLRRSPVTATHHRQPER